MRSNSDQPGAAATQDPLFRAALEMQCPDFDDSVVGLRLEAGAVACPTAAVRDCLLLAGTVNSRAPREADVRYVRA